MAKLPSYAHGSLTPLLGDTIGENLRRTVERFGSREALVVRSQGYRATYTQLWEAVSEIARAFIALGLERGDRIALFSPNRFEWVVSQFAAARAGLILTNVNPAYKTSELEYVLTQSGAKALLLAKSFRQNDYVQMLAEIRPRLTELREVFVFDTDWETLRAWSLRATDADLAAREQALQFDDAINIQYTSGTTGTTGAPKRRPRHRPPFVSSRRAKPRQVGGALPGRGRSRFGWWKSAPQ